MRKKLQLFVILLCVSSMSFAQVSGVVYRDFNGDGTRGTAIPSVEPGVGGVIVKAYNASETLVANTVSDNTGAYTLSTTGSVRVEFEIPAAMNCVSTAFDFTGFHDDGNNIRFITGSATNVNYGILFPDDYTPNANPFVYVPVFHSGNPLGAGTAASASGFLGYEFNSTSTPTNLKTATASGIGAVWGTAYSKQANKIFTAAFIKRQVGLGPMGTGGIYMLEPTASSFNITQFYNLDANGYRTRAASSAPAYGQSSSYTVDANGYVITYNGSNDSESGFPEGLGVVGTNVDRGLPDNMNADCYDPASFDQVGKVGLGDLDISDDGKYLFVMNLYSRKLYRLELNDAYNPTSVVAVSSYAIPSVAVTNGELRPFAVQYHRGRIYCGAVASGENGGSNTVDGATDLYAHVFEMTNPLGAATFTSTPILSYPLNYQKGYAITTMNNPAYNKWFPWTNNANSALPDPFGETMYPTPMLTNIDFSDRGDMIMDFTDRSGHQFGYNNYKYLSTSLAYVGLDIGGDVLIAGKDCATNAWVLENDGAINSNGTTLTGNSTSNNEGPGNGEFFAQDRATDDYHHETSQGAVAIVPGTTNGIFTVMDPESIFQGGTSRFSTENGIDNNRTVLYGGSDGEFSKANGLGDIEVAGEEPPIEVGNLVWNDANGDGVQSAGEVGIGDVTLELFCDFDNDNAPDGAAIATVITNSNGQWYFNESNVTDGDCNAAGAQLGLQPNKTYIVRIGSADWTGGSGTGDLALKGLTLLNSTSAGMVDKSDNDASLVSSVPQLQFTTGKWGENNHSYDFGFADCIADAGNNITLNCTTTSGTIGTAAVSGNTYSWSPATGLNNASIAQPTASPTVTTTYTLTVNGICTDEVTVTVDHTAPTADAGSNVTLTCTTTSATIGTVAISGNTYSWSPSTGLDNASVAQPTATPTVNTNYTVTVTGSNGCTATDVVTVTLDKVVPVADAGSNVTLTCTTTSAMIGTVAISGNTYSWSPSTGLDNASIAQPTATPTVNTNYTVTVTGSNGCTATDVVSVTLDKVAPTADAGNNVTLTCTTTSAMIGTSAISGNTYSWSPSTGLDNASIAQPTATPTVNTNYTVTVTGSNGCTATDVISVTVDKVAPTADAGSNVTLTCTTTSATIGTVAISGNTYSWSPSTGLDNASVAQPTATPTVNTNYTVTVTGSNGCTATDVVTVTLDKVVPVADAGSNVTLTCTTTSAMIGTVAISGNTYSWSPSTSLDNASIAQPTATPTVNTNYTVTVTGSNGCTATDVVDVILDLALPTADAGNNITLTCSMTSATIGTVALSGNTYSWSPSVGLNDANLAEPITNVTANTIYTVTVTGANGCTAMDAVSVDMDKNAPSVFISGNLEVCNGSTTTLTVNGGVSWIWAPSGETSSSIVAAAGNYTVTATAANGCTATAIETVQSVESIIGNYVWNDMNGNGLQDESSSAGINGVIVELWKETSSGSNVYAWDRDTITANDGVGNPGYYKFVVCEAANYKVKFPITSGLLNLTDQTSTPETDLNSDASAMDGFSPVFAINPNGAAYQVINQTIDAGYSLPAQLGNYVWNDLDKDGIQDANEVGVAGITVMLYDAANQVVGSTITDGYGYYKFNPLEDGIYSVSFTLPANYVFSDANQGSDDEADSDVNPSTGWTTTYTLMPGDSNMSVDAGIHFESASTATVGNFVWYDTNQDGIQDAGEEGISGVTVTLYDNTGATIATVITNSNGFYLFTDVAPGIYTVGFTPPAGLTFSPNNGSVNNPSNSDVIPASGTTATFTVNAGDHITYVDAGLYSLPANLGGLGDKVWYDVNQNGVQEAGESGVPDVTVTLFQSDGTTQLNQTQTDAFGNYIFNNLPQGQYIVAFSNLPSGYSLSPTTGTDSTTNSDANQVDGKTPIIYLSQGQFNMTYDAGIYNTTPSNNNSIGNYVWLDLDKDGIQDNNEFGKSGITATLYSSSNVVIATTSTDASGYYLFPNLPNGDYYVGFSNLPSNFVFTQTGAGTTATDSDPNLVTGFTGIVSLTGNTHDMSLDAGIYRGSLRIGIGASLGDIVWYDMNGNGLQDQGESGVPGVTVTLYQSDATTVISTTTTNALGNYIFTGLVEETYVVGFSNLPSGFTISPKNADAQGLNGELNSDVNVGTQQTDAILLGEGEDKLSVDMGIVPPPISASLGNLVWFDLNNDGLQNSGEPGVQGIGVALLDNAGNPVQYTTTNSNGEYYFVGLTPDTYSVQFTNLPSGYEFTQANADAAGINGALNSDADVITGSTATVTLGAGDNNLNLDAGIISTTVAAVGDYVWFDADRDGIQDATETGIGGVLVTLYDNTGTPVTSTITGPDGGYIFTNVIPGVYTIGFDNIPDGMEFTQEVGTPTDNTNSNADPVTGMTDAFTVTPGSYNPTIDAGVTIPATAGLGNYVWLDVNEDGLQDANEPSVAGVLATLYASNGTTVLATAVTDGNGAYSFINLEEGTYVVGFSNLPIGTVPTQNVGVLNDALNSDMGILTRKTTPVFLPNGTYNPNLDAGIYYGVPVPVHELKANYAMIKEGGMCDVYWYTTDEKNAVNFDIERSIDGINFTSVGSKDAKGTTIGRSIYSYTDNITSISSEPVIYYRIRLNDLDGHSMLSNVISVTSDATGGSVIYPSPFTTELTILYPSTGNNELDVLMTDASGRTVRHENKVLENGLNMVRISGLDALAAGQYYIKLRDFNSGETFIHKVSK